MNGHLAIVVESTLARMAALREADDQLARRTAAIRAMHFIEGRPKDEVTVDVYDALREAGLTREELKGAGVSHASLAKILRTAR